MQKEIDSEIRKHSEKATGFLMGFRSDFPKLMDLKMVTQMDSRMATRWQMDLMKVIRSVTPKVILRDFRMPKVINSDSLRDFLKEILMHLDSKKVIPKATRWEIRSEIRKPILSMDLPMVTQREIQTEIRLRLEKEMDFHLVIHWGTHSVTRMQMVTMKDSLMETLTDSPKPMDLTKDFHWAILREILTHSDLDSEIHSVILMGFLTHSVITRDFRSDSHLVTRLPKDLMMGFLRATPKDFQTDSLMEIPRQMAKVMVTHLVTPKVIHLHSGLMRVIHLAILIHSLKVIQMRLAINLATHLGIPREIQMLMD